MHMLPTQTQIWPPHRPAEAPGIRSHSCTAQEVLFPFLAGWLVISMTKVVSFKELSYVWNANPGSPPKGEKPVPCLRHIWLSDRREISYAGGVFHLLASHTSRVCWLM